MPVVKLTQEFINTQLKCPSGRRIEYVSDERSGLYIEVRSTSQGHGTYYLRYKDINGKTCHQKIGRSTEMSLAEAKQESSKLKLSINVGGDPRAEEKARLAVITLDDFFNNHYLPYATPRKRSIKRDEQLYRIRIKPKFGHLRLNQITRQELQTFHTSLLMEGLAKATANLHVKLLKHMGNLAVEWEMLEKNPATRLPLFQEDNFVENYLSQEDLGKLLSVLHSYPIRPVCFIVLFLLSTGARLAEARKATWSNIDEENRIWWVPSSNSKSKKLRSIPLNDSALSVLKQLNTKGVNEYLFVNEKTGLPYVTIHKTFQKITTLAGIHGRFRCHDARHCFASFLVNSGMTLAVIGRILGHSDPSVTTRYAHLSTKSMQDAADTASVIINAAMSSAVSESNM